MSLREGTYLVLALAGLVATWYFLLAYAAGGGSLADIPSFLRLAYANDVASSFASDLVVAFAAFAVFSIAEARRIAMRRGWIYPLLGLCLGLAFALPLFLFARERRMRSAGEVAITTGR